VAGVPIRYAAVALVWLARPVASPAADLYARMSPEADRHLLTRPEFKAMFLDDLLNGSRKQLADAVQTCGTAPSDARCRRANKSSHR
jgi:hypothetical protein